MRTLTIAFGLMLIAGPAFSQDGLNPLNELAMHVVADEEYYVTCSHILAWCPPDCRYIDNWVTEAEIQAMYYQYINVIFCCYNVTGVSGVEWAVDGIPKPKKCKMYYCPVTGLNPIGVSPLYDDLSEPPKRGILWAFPCIIPDPLCGGVICFADCWMKAAQQTPRPFDMVYIPSNLSYGASPRNYVMDCSPKYVQDVTYSEHGCRIGGIYPDDAPPELPPYEDCDPGATATDATTWSNVKAMYR